MGRKILFVTTDQQRYDTLGCNGGTRRPHAGDRRARRRRASATSGRIPQSVVCMPSRSTMLTGQHPSTHGVWMNGVPLPVDAPSVAAVLHDAGYRTALDRQGRTSSRSSTRSGASPRTRSRSASDAPTRGPTARSARTAASSTSSSPPTAPSGTLHYARWLAAEPPRGGRACSTRCSTRRFEVNAAGGGDTGAPQVQDNPIPRDWYHTDWVADRTIALARLARRRRRLVLLDELPRPAPPVGPAGSRRWAASTGATCRCPPGYPTDRGRARARSSTPSRATGGCGTTARSCRTTRRRRDWVPATLTADQVREVNARNAVECELIDEALGRVLAAIAAPRLGRRRRRDLHDRPRRAAGRLRAAVQGPVPRRRADAAAAGLAARAVGRRRRRPSVTRPVGLVDLAPTFCAIAGARAAPSGCRARRFPSTTPTPTRAASSGCSPSGTASCSASACTSARSPATAGCAPPTGRAPCTTAPRASSTTSPTTRCSSVNRWDDPALRVAAHRPRRRPLGPPAPGTRAAPPARGAGLTVRQPDDHAGEPWDDSST